MKSGQLQVCDLTYLFELAKGDMAFVREMVQVFLEENGGELDKLAQAITDENYHELRQIAHKLRSSVPYVGLDLRIGDDLQAMEDLARRQQGMEEISAYYSKIREVCSAAIDELSHYEV